MISADIMQGRNGSIKGVWEKEFQGATEAIISLRTFQRWYSKGSVYASIASAGSCYLLLIIASKKLSSKVFLWPVKIVSAVCRIIRWPFGITSASQDVLAGIIPVVNELRQKIPCHFSSMFSTSVLQSLGISGKVPCHDLVESDRFFDKITHKYDFFYITARAQLIETTVISNLSRGMTHLGQLAWSP
jgi:hypothetical protein